MTKDSKKIVYMGTPLYAREILEALIRADDMDVKLIFTQPDRPVGRKRVLTPPPVKELAVEHGISVLQPERLREDGIAKIIADTEPDFIIVAAFGQILPKDILDIAPCINLHASILPQYRGASPIQQTLLHGDRVTGVTAMLMEEGLDTGDILKVIEYEIPEDMRLHALTQKLTEDAATLTLNTIREYDDLSPIPQDDNQATLCKKIKKSDGEVDFSDASTIYSKYRAFEGWPGLFLSNGTKIDNIELVSSEKSCEPYKILSFDGDSILVGCSRGILSVGTLQAPSKKPMSAKAYCNGRGLKSGDSII